MSKLDEPDSDKSPTIGAISQTTANEKEVNEIRLLLLERQRPTCIYDALDQDKQERLAASAKLFYNAHMRAKRERRRKDMISFAKFIAVCSVVGGMVYCLIKGWTPWL